MSPVRKGISVTGFPIGTFAGDFFDFTFNFFSRQTTDALFYGCHIAVLG